MTDYEERVVSACVGADVTAMLLVSDDGTDTAIWPICPIDESRITPPQEFVRRRLRSIGLVGLHGDVPRFAFKESLPLDVVTRAALSFAEYVRERRAMNAEMLEIFELERLYTLLDDRMN